MTSHALRVRKRFVARRERHDAAGGVAGATLIFPALNRMRNLWRGAGSRLRLCRRAGRLSGLRASFCRLVTRLTRVVGAAVVIGWHRLEAALGVAGKAGLAAGHLMRDGWRTAGAWSRCGSRGCR